MDIPRSRVVSTFHIVFQRQIDQISRVVEPHPGNFNHNHFRHPVFQEWVFLLLFRLLRLLFFLFFLRHSCHSRRSGRRRRSCRRSSFGLWPAFCRSRGCRGGQCDRSEGSLRGGRLRERAGRRGAGLCRRGRVTLLRLVRVALLVAVPIVLRVDFRLNWEEFLELVVLRILDILKI